jgi:uncharacterized protein YdeI (YjbR/CyaY-like superfamily)
MPKLEPKPESIRAFASTKELERWYKANHDKQSELYVRIYKKGSDVATVSHAEALDVALCWGWIDGVRKSYDADSFLQRFSPRKAKSIWSQINREHVARLIAAERMTPHGLKQIEAAKADGRWQAAYAGSKTMTMPEDLRAAIAKNSAALKTFQTLSKQNLYALAFRLGNLKTEAARTRRIATYVEQLARGETIHPNGSKGQRSKAGAKD